MCLDSRRDATPITREADPYFISRKINWNRNKIRIEIKPLSSRFAPELSKIYQFVVSPTLVWIRTGCRQTGVKSWHFGKNLFPASWRGWKGQMGLGFGHILCSISYCFRLKDRKWNLCWAPSGTFCLASLAHTLHLFWSWKMPLLTFEHRISVGGRIGNVIFIRFPFQNVCCFLAVEKRITTRSGSSKVLFLKLSQNVSGHVHLVEYCVLVVSFSCPRHSVEPRTQCCSTCVRTVSLGCVKSSAPTVHCFPNPSKEMNHWFG